MTDETISAVVTSSEINVEVSQGFPGVDGQDGVTPNVSVGATNTIPAGSPAAVSNTGVAPDVVLNFDIPQGEKGDTGDQGEQGEQGLRGPQGFTGAQGIQGETGEQGPQGPAGQDGVDGQDGATELNDLDDVSLTSLNVSDIISYDGVDFTNQPLEVLAGVPGRLNNIVVGTNVTSSSGDEQVGLGDSIALEGNYSVAIGKNASATGGQSFALGFNAFAQGSNSTALGGASVASGDFSLSAGLFTSAGTRSVSLGPQCGGNFNETVAIGNFVTLDADFQMKLGNSNNFLEIPGVTKTLHQPYIKLGQISQQSAVTVDNGFFITIEWDELDGEHNPNGGWFTHDTVTNNHEVTILQDGIYEVKCVSGCDSGAAERSFLSVVPVVNSTDVVEGIEYSYIRGQGFNSGLGHAKYDWELTLTAGDVLSFKHMVWDISNSSVAKDHELIPENNSLIIRRIN